MTPPEKVNYLVNPSFEMGLKGWKSEGDVSIDSKNAINGKSSTVIGSAGGRLWQSYKVGGERILWVSATIEAQPAAAGAQLKVSCLDRTGRVLLSLSAKPGNDKSAGIYFKTHSFTDRILVTVEAGSGARSIVDNLQLNDEEKLIVRKKPLVSLNDAMAPFWEGHKISDESVLLLSNKGEQASGRLLFAPSKIVSVTDSTRQVKFKVGVDFDVVGNKLIARKNSKIPVMSDKEFVTGEFPWTRFDGRHVFVTYEHTDTWTGPRPANQSELLPKTSAKLKSKRLLNVAAYGDSITLGINVSGFLNNPPYLPPWPSLVAHRLGKVRLFNLALGGATSQWAKDNAQDLVGSLRPDLVLIAFGMNDFWSLTPKQFAANIKDAMAEIRKVHPDSEFLLISSMKFDPDYTKEEPYVSNLAGYAAELRALSGPGVAFFDMTELSQALYNAKSSKDLTTDPMHPDDFLARCYAQGVVATIQPQ